MESRRREVALRCRSDGECREGESKSPGAGLFRAKQSGDIAARRRKELVEGIDPFLYDLRRKSNKTSPDYQDQALFVVQFMKVIQECGTFDRVLFPGAPKTKSST